MIESEHLVEERTLGVAQEGQQCVVAERLAGRVEQRLAALPQPLKVERVGSVGDRPGEPQLTARMQEVVGRAGFDAEQQVEDGGPDRRLARLVGADQHVEIARRGWQRQ